MSLQGAPPVKAAVGEHPADLLQGHLQGPVKENLLEEVHLGLAVDAVAVGSHPGGLEQANLVVVAQGAGADAGESGQLFNSVFHRCFLPASTVRADAAAKSRDISQFIYILAIFHTDCPGWHRDIGQTGLNFLPHVNAKVTD